MAIDFNHVQQRIEDLTEELLRGSTGDTRRNEALELSALLKVLKYRDLINPPKPRHPTPLKPIGQEIHGYLVTYDGEEYYQGGNAVEATIIGAIITGVTHHKKLSGAVKVTDETGRERFYEEWKDGEKTVTGCGPADN